MRLICSLLIYLFSFLGGSSIEAPQASPIVTQVQVSLTSEGQVRQCTYSNDNDMAPILDYLRRLDPQHKADIDPDTFQANHWEVIVCYADGRRSIYRQLHKDYLQKDNGLWRQITAEDDLLFLFS